MKSRADVVIIGGGIQGTSVAYHLARQGITDVVLLEMDLVGSGSSGRSAAMLELAMSQPETIKLSDISYHEYERFPAELDVEPVFRQIGRLSVATEESESELREEIGLQRRMHVPIEALDSGQMKQLVPALRTDDLVLGMLCRSDGVLDPHAIMQTYARAGRRLGVEIDERVQATSIEVEKGRVAGVETTGGRIATGLVVNAAGARAREVGSWVGLDLPMINYRRHIFITDAFPQIPDDTPFVDDVAAEWYFRKEGPGILMGMGREETSLFEPEFDWDFQDKIIQAAIRRVPLLAEARILRGWAGLRPVTPDDLPIIGIAPGIDGFVNCCGWGGHGVMHAPAGGLLTAEVITGGQALSMDIAPFRYERFGK
ncbi:MAG: NAD(P)/FAD-dependent oxidoreductase [Rudaea sp.]